MKHLIRGFIVLGTVMCLAASAAPVPCTPMPPEDFHGTLQAGVPGNVSFAASYFEQNGCDWAGADGLNGTDAYIVDVTGRTGTGTVSGNIQGGILPVMTAYFLSEACEAIGEPQSFAADGQNTYAVTFPEGAKWLVVHKNDVLSVAAQISFDLHYDGKICEVVKAKKKKKRR
jgi:hypothetical protein